MDMYLWGEDNVGEVETAVVIVIVGGLVFWRSYSEGETLDLFKEIVVEAWHFR